MFSANTSQVSNDVKYIEDFFSAWLRTGTGSSQTVTTGIKENTGALVISKSRSAATDWAWYDTFRGATKDLASNTTAAETTQSQGLTAFNTDGHTWGTLAKVNTSGATYVDFVLKPTPKFFDVVTYTGNGTAGRQIPHSLESVPGCIIVKRTDSGGTLWAVYHRSLGATQDIALNSSAAAGSSTLWNSTAPTDAVFSVGSLSAVNANGGTYVAYLFAHNAGGFGLTGTDNVISCGSYTGNSSTNGPTVTLGYEPQWVMIKNVTTGGDGYDWLMADNMRGIPMSGNTPLLAANLSSAEDTGSQGHAVELTATGFKLTSPYGALNNTGNTYIYIAIRRGPMKVPESGTSVFTPVAQSTTGSSIIPAGFPVDLSLIRVRDSSTFTRVFDRLRGKNNYLRTSATTSETVDASTIYTDDYNTGVYENIFLDGFNGIYHFFRRAPGTFDEVCYAGDNTYSNSQRNHNLGVAPELVIIKNRTNAESWQVLFNQQRANLNLPYAFSSSPYTANTSTLFSTSQYANGSSSENYVAYLWATNPGVTKVGTYTGNGSSQTINCGFTGGARFVMIKSVSADGNWLVADSSRGINGSTDPALYLNSTSAEITGYDWIDADSSGFIVNETATIAANTNGVQYVYLSYA